MRRIPGHLVLGVVNRFLVVLPVIGGAAVLVAFTALTTKTNAPALPLAATLELAVLLAARRLDVVLPLTALFATMGTYRTTPVAAPSGDDRRTASWRRLVPAAILGTAIALLSVSLHDHVVPGSKERGRAVLRRHLGVMVDTMLRTRNHLGDDRFEFEWGSVGRDEEGFTVLHDVVVQEVASASGDPVTTRAREAIPRIDAARGELLLTLRHLVHGSVLASESLDISLDLVFLAENALPPAGIDEKTSHELAVLERDHGEDRVGREAAIERHRRLAAAVSALLMALLGAVTADSLRGRGRAVSGATVALLFALHWGAASAAARLADQGALPPSAVWAGCAVSAACVTGLLALGSRR